LPGISRCALCRYGTCSKTAAEVTRSGVVGVQRSLLFKRRYMHSVIRRFANGVTVLQDTCRPGKTNRGWSAGAYRGAPVLESALRPMLAIDVIYGRPGMYPLPFVIPLIRRSRTQRARD
jgi:hypothetical protein